jgi:ribulose-5-phosphate 4-epimerase/fuculose-1-phosphate aldolase
VLRVGGRAPQDADEASRQVAAACQILSRFGQEDLTLGHVSVRGPEMNTIHIKRKGKALGEVQVEDVMPISLDEEHGYLAPGAHLETVMHTEAYLARPDVGAAVHTHPLYATALGATDSNLAFLSHDAVLFRDGVSIFDGTAGLVTSAVEGKGVAKALGDRRAVLLKNHGIFVVGKDVSWAVLATLTLERAVRLQLLARTLGEPTPIPQHLVDDLFPNKYQDEFLDEYWEAWCRLISGNGPEDEP